VPSVKSKQKTPSK
jgi:hypothetical protein